MKKHFLFGLLLALAGPAAAQHTELSGRAGLGLLRFGGPDAARVSGVSYYEDYLGEGPNGSAYDPFGQRLGAGFALGGHVQRVGLRSGLLAIEVGYDWLRSQTTVNQVDYSSSLYSSFRASHPADGTTRLRTQNLTAFLGLGRRFKLAAAELDVLAGPEVAGVFGMRENGSGTYDGGRPWATNQARSAGGRSDVRLRADLTTWFHQVGFTASYVYGLSNYRSDYTRAGAELYSRTLRLGLAYRLR